MMKKNNFILLSCFTLCLLFSCQKETPIYMEEASVAKTNANTLVNDYYSLDSLGKKVQFFNKSLSALAEQNRLQLNYKPSDFLPTGLYLAPNQTLILDVEQISGTGSPSLLIGTYGRTGVATVPQEVKLDIGENSITAGDKGGLLWIRYCSDALSSGRVKITFKTGYTTAPLFIKNKTNPADFAAQISNASADVSDALLIGQNTYVVLQKTQEGLGSQNNNSILEKIDSYRKIQSDLMGLDNSTNLHAPTKIPQLFTISLPAYAGGWAYHYTAATSYDVKDDYLFTPRHEFGHLNQQSWTVQQETIGQFFGIATAIDANIPKDSYCVGYGTWNSVWAAVNNYFAKSDSERDFTTAEGQVVPGLNGGGFLSAAMLIQLKLAFGNDFYRSLYKVTREEKPNFVNNNERYEYFMIKSCIISRTDLTDFLKKWGFKFPNAYIKIADLKLPKPATDPSTLTTAN